MRKIFVLLLLSFCALHANWEDLILPCKGKKRNHSMAGIDFIYMINLKERPKKWEASIKQLLPFGIFPYRFDAINGWHNSEAFASLKGELADIMTPGRIGCLLSHLSVLQDAYDSGYNTIWMMEDDIQVFENPNQISKLIVSLDKRIPDWDILYTDPETKDYDGNRVRCLAIRPRPNFPPQSLDFYLRRIPINETFMEIGMRYGCYSMIIRRAGIKKILEYFTRYRLHLPLDMELFFIPGLKQIVITRDIVSTQPGTPSDTNYSLEENDQKFLR